MSDSEATPAERAQQGLRNEVTGSRAAVGLVFVWVIFGAYNIDLVQAIHDGSGSNVAFYPGGGWAHRDHRLCHRAGEHPIAAPRRGNPLR
jgi:hypothetical protein